MKWQRKNVWKIATGRIFRPKKTIRKVKGLLRLGKYTLVYCLKLIILNDCYYFTKFVIWNEKLMMKAYSAVQISAFGNLLQKLCGEMLGLRLSNGFSEFSLWFWYLTLHASYWFSANMSMTKCWRWIWKLYQTLKK